jgi:hypothetical protein
MEQTLNEQVVQSSQRAEGSLFTFSAISEHLRVLGYPETSLMSMQRCGNPSGQAMIRHCPTCGDYCLLNMTHHCNLRTCEECSKIRQRKLKRKLFPMFQDKATTRGSFKSLYFLTISPKNYIDLKDGLRSIKASWKRFYRSKYVRDRVDGGVWVIESKSKNKDGFSKGWNIHIHALFYGRRLDNVIRGLCNHCKQNFIKCDKITKKYYCANSKCKSHKEGFSQDLTHNQNSKIVSLWEQVNNENVHIDIQELKSSEGGLNYILKYISANKNEFASSQDFAKYIFHTRKQKLINTFGQKGLFFQFKFPEPIFICGKCGSDKLEFIFDPQVVNAILDARRHRPKDELNQFTQN